MQEWRAVEWRQVVASFVLLGCAAVITATYSLVAVSLAREFPVSRLTLMLPITIVSGVSALISPTLGRVMDRGRLRPLMLTGGILLALGYAALSLVTSFWMVVAIFGVLMAPANVLLGPVAVSVLLSRWFVAARGRALGIAMAGISVGGFVFSPIVQGLIAHEGLRSAFPILGAIVAACAVPAALLVAERPVAATPDGHRPDGARPIAAHPAAARSREGARAILSHPDFWVLGLIVAIVMAGVTGLVSNLAPLVLDRGLSAGLAAAMISVFTGCSFVAKLLFAAMADRLGPVRLIRVVLVGFAVGAACLSVPAAGLAPLVGGVALIGLFGGLVVPLQSLLVPRIFGADVVGQVMGMLSVVILVALLATPPLFGFVFDRTGSYQPVFVSFALAALLLLFVARRLGPAAADATGARSAAAMERA